MALKTLSSGWRVWLLSPICLLFAATLATADTIAFTDTAGQQGVTTSFAGDFIFCTSSPCTVVETGHFSPVSAADLLAVFGIDATIYIGDANGYISDELITAENYQQLGPSSSATNIDYAFTSGLNLTSSPATCASVGGCQFTANGTVQVLGSMTWTNTWTNPGLSDTITFQSLSPEPGSAWLLIGALCLTWIAARRKSRIRT